MPLKSEDVMSVISGLEPAKVLEFFELLSSVPHGSGNTKAVSDLCVEFARKRGLRVLQDASNNVVIFKEATAGYESAPTVILQGHLDMVCAKTADNPIDMAKEPITLVVENGFLRADRTSLGGDNIIAVAMTLAVLDSDELAHPAIEAVFTVDEEVGLLGAAALDTSVLSGRILLNIDSEEEGVFTAGCAGGVRANCSIPVGREKSSGRIYTVKIEGLLGGHSGCDIDKGRGNANQLMIRMLFDAEKLCGLRLIGLEGGKFDNVITLASMARVLVPSDRTEEFEKCIKEYDRIYKNEFKATDPKVSVSFAAEDDGSAEALNSADTRRALTALLALPYGIQVMSAEIKGLVQTSLNPGIMKLENNSMDISFSVRSGVGTQKEMLVTRLRAIIENAGGTVSLHGEYPAWEYRNDSAIKELCVKTWEKLFGKKAVVTATHGGLECGLFSDRIDGLDCISFGPNLFDVHSERERLELASAERLWKFLCELLKNIK